MDTFHEKEIIALASKIIDGLEAESSPIEIKSAALKTAAATLENAVTAQVQLAAIKSLLSPRR